MPAGSEGRQRRSLVEEALADPIEKRKQARREITLASPASGSASTRCLSAIASCIRRRSGMVIDACFAARVIALPLPVPCQPSRRYCGTGLTKPFGVT